MQSDAEKIEGERLHAANVMLRENAADLTEGKNLASFLSSVLKNAAEFAGAQQSLLWLEHGQADGSPLLLSGEAREDEADIHAIDAARRLARSLRDSPEVQEFGFEIDGLRDLASTTHAPATAGGAMIVPIVFTQERLGYILIWNTPEEPPHSGWKELLQAVASQVAVAAHLADAALQVSASAVTNEQQRIGRELHDTLAQSLTFIAKQFERVVSSDYERNLTVAAITECSAAVQDGLVEVRRALQTLAHQQIKQTDFKRDFRKALSVQRNRFEGRLLITVEPRWASIASASAHEITRIAQEAVNNAVAHARATRIVVALTSGTEGDSVLTVEDNGIGFDSAAPTNTFGMSSIRARVSSLSGVLTIVSSPGEGTRLVVAWHTGH